MPCPRELLPLPLPTESNRGFPDWDSMVLFTEPATTAPRAEVLQSIQFPEYFYKFKQKLPSHHWHKSQGWGWYTTIHPLAFEGGVACTNISPPPPHTHTHTFQENILYIIRILFKVLTIFTYMIFNAVKINL